MDQEKSEDKGQFIWHLEVFIQNESLKVTFLFATMSPAF